MSIESLNAFSMNFFSLKGKTAIVTGGNSGLGQAFAMALAKAGANLFIPSFVKDNGETKEIIEKQGVEVEFMQVDITAKGAPGRLSPPAASALVRSISWSTTPGFVN
jgi:NAD(P)-dependent dehydrogenase (short-subunit alcohol dehydrogenase family)